MASAADFKVRFPEFAAVADARIDLFLEDAALLMASSDRWLDFYDVAQVYFAAHMLVVGDAQESGDVGVLSPVRGQTVDDVSIQNAVMDVHPGVDELLSTSYGKRYWQYRRIVFAGIYGA